MDMGSILVLLALAVLAAAFIARPLFERENGRGSGAVDERHSVLLAEKNRILAMLQELEQDYAMGKILPEDYEAQRAGLVARGAEVLKSIDELRGDRGLEAAVAARRRSRGAKVSSAPAVEAEAALEAAVAARRKESAEGAAGSCTQCGTPFAVGDRFCTHCGAPLIAEAKRA